MKIGLGDARMSPYATGHATPTGYAAQRPVQSSPARANEGAAHYNALHYQYSVIG